MILINMDNHKKVCFEKKKYLIKSCHLTRRFGVEHVLGVSSNSRLELPTYFRAISSYLLNFADFYQELISILPISTNIRVFFCWKVQESVVFSNFLEDIYFFFSL